MAVLTLFAVYTCCCRCWLKGQVWSKLSGSEGPSGSLVFRDGLGMACFSFLAASRMGRCLLTIFVKLVSLGWNVVTRGT